MISDRVPAEADVRRKMMLANENALYARGCLSVAGVDEAGRGPLAGPVVAAAVIFKNGAYIRDVDDSKRLSPAKRAELYDIIAAQSIALGVGIVDNLVIDEINILNATFLAMDRAVAALPRRPEHLLIDGNRFRGGDATAGIPFTTLIGGDGTSESIAAASIIAKVTRDRLMVELDREFPAFGFAQHKGYGTREHRAAIARFGLSPVHRRSFAVRWEPGHSK